jgi:hypothetical protein
LLVLGDDPFGALLDETVASRPQHSKPLDVRRSRRLEDAGGAQIVYVSDSEKGRLDEVLAATGRASILTVSGLPGFARRGGVVGFVLEQRRVRFEINQGAAERAGLRVSSRLLNLARIVETAPPER